MTALGPAALGHLKLDRTWLHEWWEGMRQLPARPERPPEFDHPDDVLAEMQRATFVDAVVGRLGRLTVPRFDLRALRANVARLMLPQPAGPGGLGKETP